MKTAHNAGLPQPTGSTRQISAPLYTRLSVTRVRSQFPQTQRFAVIWACRIREDAGPMRKCAGHCGLRRKAWLTALVLAFLSVPGAHAASCTTQGEMNAQDRDTLASAGQQLGN